MNRLNTEKLVDSIGNIDEDMIEYVQMLREKPPSPHRMRILPIRAFLSVAACLVVMVSALAMYALREPPGAGETLGNDSVLAKVVNLVFTHKNSESGVQTFSTIDEALTSIGYESMKFPRLAYEPKTITVYTSDDQNVQEGAIKLSVAYEVSESINVLSQAVIFNEYPDDADRSAAMDSYFATDATDLSPSREEWLVETVSRQEDQILYRLTVRYMESSRVEADRIIQEWENYLIGG